eukprot:1157994-Pelagomonas_calceolata.AAC.5
MSSVEPEGPKQEPKQESEQLTVVIKVGVHRLTACCLAPSAHVSLERVACPILVPLRLQGLRYGMCDDCKAKDSQTSLARLCFKLLTPLS